MIRLFLPFKLQVTSGTTSANQQCGSLPKRLHPWFRQDGSEHSCSSGLFSSRPYWSACYWRSSSSWRQQRHRRATNADQATDKIGCLIMPRQLWASMLYWNVFVKYFLANLLLSLTLEETRGRESANNHEDLASEKIGSLISPRRLWASILHWNVFFKPVWIDLVLS